MLEAPRDLLRSVTFTKPGTALHTALGKRIKETRAKVDDRRKRIVDLRAAHDITDADMVELLTQQRANDRAQFYSLSSVAVAAPAGRKGAQASPTTRAIAAGVVANLAQESDLVRSESEAAERWTVIHRNLDQTREHTVTLADLEFLGF